MSPGPPEDASGTEATTTQPEQGEGDALGLAGNAVGAAHKRAAMRSWDHTSGR